MTSGEPPPDDLTALLDRIGGEESTVEDDIATFAALAELAYTRMYESRWPKDERDEALLQLSMALRIARALKLEGKVAELTARYDHIEAVFNSQFRGWPR